MRLAIGAALVAGVVFLAVLAVRGGVAPGRPVGSTASGGEVATSADLPVLGEAKPLDDLDGWLQSDISSLDELRGRVVVVHFWTFGCVNCRATIPHLRAIYNRYAARGLEIVGVHAPEFTRERDPDAIASAAADLGVIWPIALDTRRSNFRAWQGRPAFWPRTYVLDGEGRIRFDRIGEGAYEELEAAVAALLST